MNPNASLAALALHGASAVDLLARAADLQRQQMNLMSGASMGGLGACRYEHFRDPEDFMDEPWATAGTRESLKKSGNILDVVITTQQVMYMAGLSALVPLGIMCGLPFHKLLLEVMKMSDWYGPILEVDFNRCMTIGAAGLFVHIAAYLLARRIFSYDRAPSILAQKTAHRLRGQAVLTVPITVAPVVFESGPGVSSPHPGAVTHGPSVMRSPTSASGSPGAMTPTVPTSPTAATEPSKPEAPPTFSGKDPNLWPLRIFCVAALMSYALLGWQGYVSCDESAGRQYGITSTHKRYWPPTAGKGPAITFFICFLVGAAAMVPIGFSLKLLALFHPRKVHPHLINKID